MREIKFHVWDKITKQICKIVDIRFKFWDIEPSTINYVTIETDGTVERLEHEIELMQFTGLQDRNGRDIYESDIIQCIDNWEGVVYWDNDDLQWWCGDHKLCDLNKPTIIGNIYENPELMK